MPDEYDVGFDDHYLQPQSTVLKNLLDITDNDELEQVSSVLAAAGIIVLMDHPDAIERTYDLRHLERIHEALFGSVYAWAGQIRDIRLHKGGSTFCYPEHIEMQFLKMVSRPLAAENFLRGLSPEKFSERAAYYMGEINAIHPFREGNGRTQREFINHLAMQNGMIVLWKAQDKEEITRLTIAAFNGSHFPLAKFIQDNLHPL